MSGLMQAIAERDVWQRRYEQLRQAIDGGSESMTHEDALAEVRDLRALADRTEELERERDDLLDNWPGPNSVRFDPQIGKYYLADDPSQKFKGLRAAARAAAGLTPAVEGGEE
jgi:hypothetical protein